MENKKLSLVAQFDDIVRFCENFIIGDDIETNVKNLLKNCEDQRLLLLIERKELLEARESVNNLKKVNKSLETTLRNVREAFKAEVNLKHSLKNERDSLFSKITTIQNFIMEDENNSDFKEKVKSSLNINKLKPVMEQSVSSDDGSLSGIEFDRTDDEILNRTTEFHSTKNRISTNLVSSPLTKTQETMRRLSKEFEEEIQKEREKLNSLAKKRKSLGEYNNYPSPKKTLRENNDQNIEDTKILKLEELEKEDQFDDNLEINFKNQQSKVSSLSLHNPRLSVLNNIQFNVDKRMHTFVTKKVLKPEKCGPCGTTISFCTSAYNCRVCRAICHITCKDKVPLPCIPYVSGANIGKHGRLILVSDFVAANCKPCVPALIVHCCKEIEKRGLQDMGLYRVSASLDAVKKLKKLILESKKGMPKLNDVDVNVLCCVVKSFLKDLDESLITKLAWRDFITATSIEDEDQRQKYILELLSNLHIANRDTLIFFILHLKKIAASSYCKMDYHNLSRVVAPTIVGFSIKDPPVLQMQEETSKIISVMENLLNLDEKELNNLLNQSHNFALNNENLAKSLSKISIDRNRMSIGSKVCAGRVLSGTLTPLKSSNIKNYSTKSSNIKPLF